MAFIVDIHCPGKTLLNLIFTNEAHLLAPAWQMN